MKDSRSILITTQNQITPQKVLEAIDAEVINPAHPDVLVLNQDHNAVKISDTRNLIIWAGKKPYSSNQKIAIILNAELLTLPAQNSLLKLLEEPPDHTVLALVTSSPAKLLPTIKSRTMTMRLTGELVESAIDDFWTLSYLERRQYLDKYKDLSRADLQTQIETLIRQYLHSDQMNPLGARKLKSILKSVSQNGNISLIFDVLAGV